MSWHHIRPGSPAGTAAEPPQVLRSVTTSGGGASVDNAFGGTVCVSTTTSGGSADLSTRCVASTVSGGAADASFPLRSLTTSGGSAEADGRGFANGFLARRRGRWSGVPDMPAQTLADIHLHLRAERLAFLRHASLGGRVTHPRGWDVRVEVGGDNPTGAGGTKLDHWLIAYKAAGPAGMRLRMATAAGGGVPSNVPFDYFVYYGKPGLAASEENVRGLFRGPSLAVDTATGADLTGKGPDLTGGGGGGGGGADVTGLTLDWALYRRLAPGSDIWPTTWSSRGVFTAWGDGGGFGGTNSVGRVACGLGRVSGAAPAVVAGVNLVGGVNPLTAPCIPILGAFGVDPANPGCVNAKIFGLMSHSATAPVLVFITNGTGTIKTLCEWTPANNAWRTASWQVGRAAPYRNWSWVFGQAGQDYAQAPDGFIYALAGRPASTTDDTTTEMMLHRIAVDAPDKLAEAAWQHFSGTPSSPAWSSDPTAQAPVATSADRFGQQTFGWFGTVRRWLMFTTADTITGVMRAYQAPAPWGPWVEFWRATVADPQARQTGPIFQMETFQHAIAADGVSGMLLLTGTGGYDAMTTIGYRLTTAGQRQDWTGVVNLAGQMAVEGAGGITGQQDFNQLFYGFWNGAGIASFPALNIAPVVDGGMTITGGTTGNADANNLLMASRVQHQGDWTAGFSTRMTSSNALPSGQVETGMYFGFGLRGDGSAGHPADLFAWDQGIAPSTTLLRNNATGCLIPLYFRNAGGAQTTVFARFIDGAGNVTVVPGTTTGTPAFAQGAAYAWTGNRVGNTLTIMQTGAATSTTTITSPLVGQLADLGSFIFLGQPGRAVDVTKFTFAGTPGSLAGLLTGGPPNVWPSTTVSFGFPTGAYPWPGQQSPPVDVYTAPGYPRDLDSVITPADAALKAATRAALAAWGTASGLTFVDHGDIATPTGAQIKVVYSDVVGAQGPTDANTFGPNAFGRGETDGRDGVMMIRADYANAWPDFASGGYGFQVVMHELGHALGLRHPPFDTVLYPYAQTIMNPDTHLESVFATAPRPLDGEAVRRLYGVVGLHAPLPVWIGG